MSILSSDFAISVAEASVSASEVFIAGMSAAASGGGISVSMTSTGFSSEPSNLIVNFEKGMS